MGRGRPCLPPPEIQRSIMQTRTLSEPLRDRMAEIVGLCPLIPVITIEDPGHVLPLGEALLAGGISTLEITLRSSHGLKAIRELRERLPGACVGAGTVTGPEQYREAEAMGAQFVVTPGTTGALLEYGLTARAPLLPGISTLSEMMEGYRLGYRIFKFFPAEVAGGVAALKAFAGPFADVRFCPTGGIRQETAADYLELPSVPAVGGSWLTPGSLVGAGRWSEVTDIARRSLEAVG